MAWDDYLALRQFMRAWFSEEKKAADRARGRMFKRGRR